MLNRKANRYKHYNYSSSGYYFVTICTKDRLPFFGKIENGKMNLNEYGEIVRDRWLWLQTQYNYVRCGEYVIMPNHFHGILIIDTIVGTGRDLSNHSSNHSSNHPSNHSSNHSSNHPSSHPSNNNGTDHESKGNNIIRTGHDLSLQKIKSLSELIGAFKTTSSKMIHKTGLNEFHWQRSFYDHIIRNETSLNKIREYIRKNPFNWDTDKNNLMSF